MTHDECVMMLSGGACLAVRDRDYSTESLVAFAEAAASTCTTLTVRVNRLGPREREQIARAGQGHVAFEG